jgi:hypothetical protein
MFTLKFEFCKFVRLPSLYELIIVILYKHQLISILYPVKQKRDNHNMMFLQQVLLLAGGLWTIHGIRMMPSTSEGDLKDNTHSPASTHSGSQSTVARMVAASDIGTILHRQSTSEGDLNDNTHSPASTDSSGESTVSTVIKETDIGTMPNGQTNGNGQQNLAKAFSPFPNANHSAAAEQISAFAVEHPGRTSPTHSDSESSMGHSEISSLGHSFQHSDVGTSFQHSFQQFEGASFSLRPDQVPGSFPSMQDYSKISMASSATSFTDGEHDSPPFGPPSASTSRSTSSDNVSHVYHRTYFKNRLLIVRKLIRYKIKMDCREIFGGKYFPIPFSHYYYHWFVYSCVD